MDDNTLRYSKQIILDGIGSQGQAKITSAKILVVGAGGLGSSALIYLAAVGVGTIGVVDFDSVSLSNLNRQTLYITEDVGRKKAIVASERLTMLNPNIKVIVHNTKIDIYNTEEIIKDYDVVIDATDNLPTRYLLSDACFFASKPIIEGAATGFIGTLMTIIPTKSSCYRCLYPIPPSNNVIPNCSNTGIVGMVTGVIGSLQALEAVKFILDIGDLCTDRVLVFNALTTEFENVTLTQNEKCLLCGKSPSIKGLIEYEIKCKTVEFDNFRGNFNG